MRRAIALRYRNIIMSISSHHLGESGSMTYGSVSVAMTSEKKGMTWEGFEPSTMACEEGTEQSRSGQERIGQGKAGQIRTDEDMVGQDRAGQGRVGQGRVRQAE